MADSYNMVSNGYLRDLTLTFPDGKTATVTVDLPTYRSAVEENDQSVIDEIVKNYNEIQAQAEGDVIQSKKTVHQPELEVNTAHQPELEVNTAHQPELDVNTSDSDSQSKENISQSEFNIHTSDSFGKTSGYYQPDRQTVLHGLIRMLADVETPVETKTIHENADHRSHELAYQKNKDETKNTIRKTNQLETKSRPTESREFGNQEKNMKEQNVSPVALYILKRLISGGNRARAVRADTIIGINSRDRSLPWEEDCSSGYKLCGGYFPMCCESFVCLKPLTPWDRKNGFNRCWPHYFQDDADANKSKLNTKQTN